MKSWSQEQIGLHTATLVAVTKWLEQRDPELADELRLTVILRDPRTPEEFGS